MRHVFGLPDDGEETRALLAASREYYQKTIPGGGHVAVFAETEAGTAGCGGLCLYREMPSPDNPGGICAYLMNIYTREPFRKSGVGRAVVRWLVGYAKERGAGKIYLETSDSGRPLYESAGFRDMRDYMILEEEPS